MWATGSRILLQVSLHHNHQKFNYDAETRTKNCGSKAHVNWTCGQGNCVAKVYFFSNVISYTNKVMRREIVELHKSHYLT